MRIRWQLECAQRMGMLSMWIIYDCLRLDFRLHSLTFESIPIVLLHSSQVFANTASLVKKEKETR